MRRHHAAELETALMQVFSFKLRGAYNKMASLTAEQRERGVITSSAGNHAQGVALAASRLVRPLEAQYFWSSCDIVVIGMLQWQLFEIEVVILKTSCLSRLHRLWRAAKLRIRGLQGTPAAEACLPLPALQTLLPLE